MKYIKKLLQGALIGITLAFIACASLSSVSAIPASVENYYDKIGVDFIIPSPWYSQIKEIQEMSFINSITPYFLHKKKISSAEKTIEINLISVENGADLTFTAYSEKVLIKGSKLTSNGIILDERASVALNANVGDKVTIGFGTKKISFDVSGIVENNRFSTKPSACIYLTKTILDIYKKENSNLAYAHAFVSSNSVSEAEEYFSTEYRAIGKVGERSWYDSDSEYLFMKESIERESVQREVINVSKLRAKENFQVEEKKTSNLIAIIISLCILLGGFPLVWTLLIVISSSSIHKRIRKCTSLQEIKNEFYFGEIISYISFAFLLFFLLGKEISSEYFISIVIALLGLLISIGLSKKILNKNKAKKIVQK